MRIVSIFDKRLLVVLVAASAALVLILWALGMQTARVAPDTPSYFEAIAGDPRNVIRHPLYGLAAHWLGAGPDKPGVVAQVQVALLIVASFALYAGARAGGIGGWGALFLALSGLLSQSAILQVGLLLPESPAIAMLMMAFAGTLAASRGRRTFWWLLLPIALTTGIGYLLRPSLLPAIIIVPLLWLLFALRNRQPHTIASTLIVFVAVASPFLGQSAMRWRAVGDFNIVSFGGYQMSAMAGFMLTPDLVARLPVAVQPTAQAILKAREAAEIVGTVARTPENSTGIRSFNSAGIGYFDIYARSYDPLLVEILKLKQPTEDWIAFDRRLRGFSVATIIAAPVQWVSWVAGASSRLAGRVIVTNAPVLVALFVLALAGVVATIRRGGLVDADRDVAAVSAVAVAWLAATAPLIVLITFPATRYIETAGVLLAAIPFMLAAALIEALRTPAAAPGNGF